jgi:hypothetical protein
MLRVQQFLRAGVSMVCLLHADESAVSVYRAGRGFEFYEESEEFSGEDVLPNFRFKVAEFFALPGGAAMSQEDHISAHKHSIRHRTEILASEICGCFYCLATFSPEDIDIWVDEKDGDGQTGLCPECGIDSVIGSAAGFPISSEFLAKMKAHWFDKSCYVAEDGTIKDQPL